MYKKLLLSLIGLIALSVTPAFCQSCTPSPEVRSQIEEKIFAPSSFVINPSEEQTILETTKLSIPTFCQKHPKVCAIKQRMKDGAKKGWATTRKVCVAILPVVQTIGALVGIVVMTGLVIL